MQNNDHLGNLAEEYHVATRIQGAHKHIYSHYQVHFEPRIQQLAEEAPLHLSGQSNIVPQPSRTIINAPLDGVITRRTSGRSFPPIPLSPDRLKSLLYLGNAVRQVHSIDTQVFYQRNVPTSGNLGSIEIYPVVMNVEGIEPGIYHFDTIHHHLACLRQGQFRTWLREKVLFQALLAEASVALILTTAFGRLHAKYGLRGYRLGLIDTGHVSENIYLAATGMGLQVCATAGFVDDELDSALGLDGLTSAATLVLLVAPTQSFSQGD
jgi:SagB-type dehydrogenase family enzyme